MQNIDENRTPNPGSEEGGEELGRRVSFDWDRLTPPRLDPSNPQPGYRWRVLSDGGPDPSYGGRQDLVRFIVVLRVTPKTVRFAFDGEIKKLPKKSFERFLASFKRVDSQHPIE